MKKILFFSIIFISLISCYQAVNTGTQGSPSGGSPNTGEQYDPSSSRLWTVIVYMAADNDLEAAAIADFNELEAVQYYHVPVTILVLLDRASGYDMTNENWTGTRLYEIKPDPNGLTGTIKSPRLDSMELGLSKDTETELNLADPWVLSRLIDFAKSNYPAEDYALLIWGHGTGWRGGSETGSMPEPVKAIAFDDTSGQYMSLPSFGRAISGKGLSVIGFDTCFAALLEVAYQIRDDARLFIGSEGEILSTGWDYTNLFNDFFSRSVLSDYALIDSIQKQFSEQYAGLNNATISQVRLSEVENLFNKFDAFAGTVANAITAEGAKNAVLDQILHSVESYYFTNFPSDMYVDILDFSKKVTAILNSITSDPDEQDAIVQAARTLESTLQAAVPFSWARNGTTNKLGVHVIPLQGIAVPAAMHELPYIKGSMSMDKSAFVENSRHWAPNMVPQSDSLLDKLFYWLF